MTSPSAAQDRPERYKKLRPAKRRSRFADRIDQTSHQFPVVGRKLFGGPVADALREQVAELGQHILHQCDLFGKRVHLYVTVERLRDFVAETVKPKLSRRDIVATNNAFSFLLGLADMPEPVLAQNPYGVAFGLGRRAQLGINPSELAQAIGSLTETDLRRAAGEIFARERSAVVAILVDRT